MGQLKFKMIPCDWGKCPEQVQGFEHLLKYTNRFYANCGQPFAISGKQSEPTFILTVQIYFFIIPAFFGDYFFADLLEVFLKSSTAWASLFTWDFLAVFILALNFLTTNPWNVL